MSLKIRFHASEGKEREEGLAEALRDGARQFDDHVEIVPTDGFKEADPEVDVACAFGVKGHTKAILDSYLALGKRAVIVDKALIRPPGSPLGYHRVCIDGPTPLKYLMRRVRTFERWERLGIQLHPKRETSREHAVVFAGSSQKYCTMHGLGDATEYAKGVLAVARVTQPKRPLVYRPKPSWTGFIPIEGTTLSRGEETLGDILPMTHVLVTHGSSAAVDAIVAGVPAITLGPCVANPVSSSEIEAVRNPSFPSDEARWQWLCNVAWCQWTVAEFASGAAWAFIRNELEATA